MFTVGQSLMFTSARIVNNEMRVDHEIVSVWGQILNFIVGLGG